MRGDEAAYRQRPSVNEAPSAATARPPLLEPRNEDVREARGSEREVQVPRDREPAKTARLWEQEGPGWQEPSS